MEGRIALILAYETSRADPEAPRRLGAVTVLYVGRVVTIGVARERTSNGNPKDEQGQPTGEHGET